MQLARRQFCLWAACVYLVWVAAASAAASEVGTVSTRSETFVGSAGCKSSSCHGGAGEKRSQYLTWSQQDFHARAYPVLVNARSARMAETLGLPSAQTSARCTVCHSPFQSVEPTRLAPAASADQGVSCESCHNAAATWLRSHTRPDWSYAMRVTAGVRDLRNFYVRANTCVACHQNLDADVLAAGHPELHFELDGQSVAEPKHWRDEPSTGAKAWLVGQAVALREVSWALANSPKPGPELVGQWNGLVWLLARVTAQQATLPVLDSRGTISTQAEFIEMQQRADSLARAAAGSSLEDDFARTTLQALAATDSEFGQSKEPRELLYRRAERLVVGLRRLAVASGLDTDTAPNPQNQQLFEALQGRDRFDPAHFSKALATYRENVINSRPRGQ